VTGPYQCTRCAVLVCRPCAPCLTRGPLCVRSALLDSDNLPHNFEDCKGSDIKESLKRRVSKDTPGSKRTQNISVCPLLLRNLSTSIYAESGICWWHISAVCNSTKRTIGRVLYAAVCYKRTTYQRYSDTHILMSDCRYRINYHII
jgi:hypothetical protein